MKFLNMAQASKKLNTSTFTLKRRIQEGKVKPTFVTGEGTTRRYHFEDRYLETLTTRQITAKREGSRKTLKPLSAEELFTLTQYVNGNIGKREVSPSKMSHFAYRKIYFELREGVNKS